MFQDTKNLLLILLCPLVTFAQQNTVILDQNFEQTLIENDLCIIDSKLKLELTDKGKKIQDSMGLHTKIMNNIKLEGKQANDLIEGMLDEL